MSQASPSRSLFSYQGVPLWRDDRVLKWAAQIISAAAVISLVVFLLNNVLQAAEERGLLLGYDFLQEAAGFPIGEGVIAYDPSMSFLRAFQVGLLNTLKVSLIGVVLATLLGIAVGLGRLSTNWLVRSAATLYVESLRNVPLLVTLFFLFFAVFQNLPSVQESIRLGDLLILNQRGVYLAWFETSPTTGAWLLVVGLAAAGALILYLVLSKVQERRGRPTYAGWLALAILLAPPLIAWLVLPQRPLTPDVPVLGRFNFEGGTTLTTSFAALLTGLTLYTAAFIAEIVRAGIQAVSRGQVEAARSIGLNNLLALRLVIFPQALRVIIPPLISQYLNLTKNSSLALAIGYPDLFAIGRIMINQAGRAVPVFLMVMATYLVISLIFSALLNIYNRRIRFTEQ
ncbi:MAG: amino acid ABC transporter permease [Candidatus Promineifilaceae bacterium]